MSRIEETEKIIAHLKKIVEQNGDRAIDFDNIYYLLTRHKVLSEGYQKKVRKEYFDKWVDYFSDKNKEKIRLYGIKAYVDEEWGNYCQFVSSQNIINKKSFIKLYIPLDYDHIELGVEQLFDFIEHSGISHMSKVSSDIRVDNVLVRVVSEQDADKIIDFVKNNEYIQEGLLEPNPFLINDSGVGIASDGIISLSQTLTILIMFFFDDMIKENRFDEISAESFYKYVELLQKKIFADFHMPSSKFPDIVNALELNSEKKLSDFKGTLNIILKSKDPNCTKEDIYKIYNFMKNENNYLYNDGKERNIVDVISDMRIILDTMISNYDEETAILNVCAYINTGDSRYLTRVNGIRKKYGNSELREEVLKYCEKNHLGIEAFLYEVCGKTKENILNEACIATIMKYDLNHCANALALFIGGGILSGFTSDHGARGSLKANIKQKDAIMIVAKNLGLSTNDFLSEEEIIKNSFEYVNMVFMKYIKRPSVK